MALAMLCLLITTLVLAGFVMTVFRTRLRRGALTNDRVSAGTVRHEARQASTFLPPSSRKKSWTPDQVRGDVFMIGAGALPPHHARPKTKVAAGAQPLPAGGILLDYQQQNPRLARERPLCLFPNFS
jgi:hypothetical protein